MGAVLVGDLKELPDRPGIAVPHQLQKAVTLQHCPVLFAAQYPPDIPRHLQVCRPLLHQFPGQGIEHPQPCKMAVLRDLNDLAGEDDKKTFGIFVKRNFLGAGKSYMIKGQQAEKKAENALCGRLKCVLMAGNINPLPTSEKRLRQG